ncbi:MULTISPECIES: SDR family NAD(P)-dependent oxidoreductase [Microbacterium]|uniref:SDR family NAD(P)-dependent oxidoreductase n=1 Tax=Microbacterium TaxID=33882 RepID=UPI000D655AA9|nr:MULTISPECIES: SDR family NAD(P)-dependent oxidoreductase [Microbacterium]
MSPLAGKVAVVTGAGSGMGRATALALLDAGAAVVVADRDPSALASLPSGDRLVRHTCDVRDPADTARFVERATSEFGELHAVFNAAGICREELLLDAGDMWTATMDVNVTGVLNVVRAAIPALKAAGGGVIVNWASNSALRASPALSAYCVSKAAVVMLTKCIAVEHAADGIRANVISPGYVDTPMIRAQAASYPSVDEWHQSVAVLQPLGIGSAESVADVAVFLASDASRHMTGSVVTVDGGAIARAPGIRPPSS